MKGQQRGYSLEMERSWYYRSTRLLLVKYLWDADGWRPFVIEAERSRLRVLVPGNPIRWQARPQRPIQDFLINLFDTFDKDL
jgi:hypothetical protein